jgi:DNA mismatch endonuclease (patch repair protein)
MRAIRSRNTKPELLVRKYLHAAGFRYRLHDKRLPGKPDIVLPRYRTVIFVHGCFWHGHDCKYFILPKTRTEFWQKKIEANQARDREHIAQLNQLAWRVIVVWECEVKAAGQGILSQISSDLKKRILIVSSWKCCAHFSA